MDDMDVLELRKILRNTDMYLIDLLQKGYFDKPIKVLDAGCGTGRNIWLLASLGNSVEACDVDEERVNVLRNIVLESSSYSSRVNVRVGEVGKLPHPNQEFDFVICNAVLHFATDVNHFENMMTDLARVVKNGGVLFVRLVSSHTMNLPAKNRNNRLALPDGTTRFVVDEQWLKGVLLPSLNLDFTEVFKTVNVDGKRSMTTLVLRTK